MVDTTGERRGVARDRIVDGGLVGLAALAGFWPAVYWWDAPQTLPVWVLHLDYVAGVVGCLALWWRRRFPLVLAVALVLLSTFSLSVSAAALIALLTVAVHRPAGATGAVAVGNLLAFVVFLVLRPGPFPLSWMLVALQGALVVGVAGWGMLVRSRRQLIASLRERAAAAEVEARLRAEHSQHEAREALARDMHDVLGHRLSLLSVHAGALTYYRGASADEIAQAAAQGRPVLSPEVTRRLIDRVAGTDQDTRREAARRKLDSLAERERTVAIELGAGRSNAEIAARHHISLATVKTHVSAILTKLGSTNRVQVALLVHDAGLDPEGS